MHRVRGVFVGLALTASTAASAGFETPVTPDIPDLQISDGRDTAWLGRVRFFTGYDSNVQFYDDYQAATGKGGLVGGVTLDGAFERILTSSLSIGGAFRADLIGYTGGSNSDYNHFSIQPSLYLKHESTLRDGTDVTLQATYSFRKTKAQDWVGINSTSHQLIGTANFDVPGPWSFFAFGKLAAADYNVFASDPASNRDGTFKEIGVGATHTFDGPFLRKISGHISYQRNDADGVNWSYSGFAVGGSADIQLGEAVYLQLNASHTARNYVGDFTSQGFIVGRNNQQVTTLGTRLIWVASPKHTFDVELAHEIVGSNSYQFTGSKTTIMGGLTINLN